jgi:AcrR family transcriptional regulator
MESKEKNTKEKILEEALKLFAQSGYMGTSMNDIASKLGVTKAALYKHYKSKQEILDSIIEKMNELDIARVKQYEMSEGDLEKPDRQHLIFMDLFFYFTAYMMEQKTRAM